MIFGISSCTTRSAVPVWCCTVNPRLTPEQIAWIINDGGATVLFAAVEFAPLLEKIGPLLKKVTSVVFMTDGGHMPATASTGLLTDAICYETLLNAESASIDWPDLDERLASCLCYTSGTTGNPKGVLYSHRSTVLHAMATIGADIMGIRAVDVMLPVVPMFHVNAWGVPFTAPIVGAKLVLPGRAAGDPATLCELINQEQVTVALGVPTVWLALLQYLDKTAITLPSLQRTIVGGAACPPSVIDEFRERHGVETHHAWGMTETSPLGTFNAPKPPRDQHTPAELRALKAKQGRAVFGVELRLRSDAGQLLPWDGKTSGNLQVRGPFVASGYYGLESSDAHTADGWFSTGDVATIDADGYLQITDRTKDVIKSGGEWISSIELENHAMEHPAIAEVAVIGVSHPKWSERPLLIAVLKPGMTVSRDELLAFLVEKVASWWVPDDVIFIADLPHTATGKVSKVQLREQFRNHLSGKPS
ncbi:MAG: long-chain fatty acid--CoA ligase [Gammaproteobacteria bacterium]